MVNLTATPDTYHSATLLNLRKLVLLRNIVISCEVIAIILSVQALGMALPLVTLGALLAIYLVLNGLTWLRVRRSQDIGSSEFTIHLAIDTIIFTVLLYHVGGYTNPFVSLFLIPLLITATVLPKKSTWFMALLTIACYTLLMFYYQPLPHLHMSHENREFDLHLLGMWFSFLLSVVIVLFFVVIMANNLREREKALARAREKALQDEHLVMLGTLATGAAHELGTPLSTLAVLAKEIHREAEHDEELQEKAQIMRQQIDRCKNIISDISTTTGQTRAEGGHQQAIEQYLENVITQWQTLRPLATIEYRAEGAHGEASIFADKTLNQALLNLLNNAADATNNAIKVHAAWSQTKLHLSICDDGPGIANDLHGSIGKAFFTTKKDGHGLGLYLANAVIERFGGTLALNNHESGGLCATVTLPLQAPTS